MSRLSMFFFLLVFVGGLLVVGASDLFFFWLGMEVMSLAFVGYLSSAGLRENTSFYFLPNAAASVSFLLGGLGNYPLLMVLGLLVKIGAAPFHFWVPSTMKGLDWLGLWVFMGPMKLAPVIGLASIQPEYHVLFLLALGILWASVSGVAQEHGHGLIAYVSIISGGWISLVSSVPGTPALFYWLMFTVTSLLFLGSAGSGASFLGLLAGLGLAGLPPGPMFIGKWAVYQFILSWLGVPLAFCLAITAVFTFCILLALTIYKFLSSGKLDSSDACLTILVWLLFCFFYSFWWW